MTTGRNTPKVKLDPAIFDNDFDVHFKLDEQDFALWAHLGSKPEQIIDAKARKKYEACLAKQQHKKKR